MTITRDVVRDLLPVYAAGEASADTQALVEEFLTHDDELRALAESARTAEVPQLPGPDNLAALELKSIDKTRLLLSRKAGLLAMSLFFSLLPLSFMLRNGRIVYLMAHEQPVLSAISLIVGLVGWVAFFDTCRRLSAIGLEAPRSLVRRALWGVTTVPLAYAVTEVLKHWTGEQPWVRYGPLWLFYCLALWLGERWRVIATMDEIHRPTSLFNGDSNPRDKHRD